eukprot:2388065-Rhodomonas_salina.1
MLLCGVRYGLSIRCYAVCGTRLAYAAMRRAAGIESELLRNGVEAHKVKYAGSTYPILIAHTVCSYAMCSTANPILDLATSYPMLLAHVCSSTYMIH